MLLYDGITSNRFSSSFCHKRRTQKETVDGAWRPLACIKVIHSLFILTTSNHCSETANPKMTWVQPALLSSLIPYQACKMEVAARVVCWVNLLCLILLHPLMLPLLRAKHSSAALSSLTPDNPHQTVILTNIVHKYKLEMEKITF